MRIAHTVRFISVGIGGIVLVSIGVYAFDTVQQTGSGLTAQLASSEQTSRGCPSGMSQIDVRGTTLCIDQYEAAASEECPHEKPEKHGDTLVNVQMVGCKPVSEPGRKPWRYISRTHAELACAKAGKRLPTAAEWYAAALGTPDDSAVCNIASGAPSNGGSYPSCVSPVGVYDMVGNVWEWVDEDVIEGEWNGRALPPSGYVKDVAVDGIAVHTQGTSSPLYNDDRFWLDATGVRGVTRGGYYNSGTDAGIFATFAASPPSLTGTAVGFRCVQSL